MIKSHNRTFLLRELQALAAQVTGEEVILIEGDVGSSWSWNWRDRVITADPKYLSDKSADVCRAILLHESAHCAITRIHHVLPRERHLLYQDILNVLEDLRIESWLAEIFPGCAKWIHTANSLIFRSVNSMNWPTSYQAQFMRAILETAHSGEIPSGVDHNVRTALDETSEAVKAQTACHPAIARGRSAARQTFNAQQRMLAIFDEKIRPVWERLVALDECAGRERITALGAKFALSCNGPKNTMISCVKKGKDSKAGDTSEPSSTLKRSYLSRQHSLHQVIDTLANELIELFETHSRQKLVLHQRSGDSIHIRTAMQAEADPRLNDKLWTRRLRNKRFDPLVILALDISGSMDGQNFDAAFDGVVVLSEVCLRSGLPFALWSFNNIARQILQPHNQTDSSARRASIDQLRSQCRGGTSMEIALAHIHSSPEISQFTDPIVFVISDGKPDDESSTAAQIKTFESEKIPLIGVGIGAETREMSALFKNSIVDVNITAVASTICKTVRKAIFDNTNPSHAKFQLRAA